MIKSRSFYLPMPNGARLHAESHLIEQPKAGVVFVHGIGEHFGRYEHVVEAFAKAGYASFGFDHYGHGQSDGKRGDVKSFSQFIDEIDVVAASIRDSYPELPLLLYGHSLGGNIGLHYLIDEEVPFFASVISAPYIRLAFQPPAFLLALAKVAAKVYPTFTQNNELDLSMLSRDPKVQQAYVNDELVHTKITARMAEELFKAGAFLDHYEGALAAPVLLLHGTGDQINAYEGSRDFARRITTELTFVEYPGFYHELHNEPEKEAVLARIIDWCDAQLKQFNYQQESE